MKNNKINYKVKVYLVNEKASYRLRYYSKDTGKFLPQFEQRFNAIDYEAAKLKRDAEQAQEKWITYKEESIERKGDFVSYMMRLIQEKEDSGTRRIYIHAVSLFKKFISNETLPINKVNKNLADEFREFLLRTVKQNTASCRFGFFAHALNKAFEDKLIETFKVKRIQQKQVKNDVLTEEDLNSIIQTQWDNGFKKIFLFECLTSVSFIDLKKLKWKNIEKKTVTIADGQKKVINKLSFVRWKTRVKTGIEVNLLLSDELMKMIGEKKNNEEYIFPELTSCRTYNNNIDRLIKKSGINKHITSHRGRATAIIRVIEGEGIFVAAKQAGHSDIKTTMRYAQYTDKMMYGAQNALMNGINL